jgi:hypothetical protein
MHGKDFGKLTFNSFETVNLTITDTTNGVADINNIKMVPSVGGGAVLNLVENQVGVIGTGTTVDVHGTTDVTANGAIKISGSDQGAVLLEGVVTASLLDASGFAGPLVTGSTSVNTDKGGATSAITILGSPQNDSLIGSTAKDTINSGAGNDIVADQLNAISKTTDNDQISLGTGKDLVNLFGDTAGAGGTALTTAVGQIPLVADFAVSTPDALGLSQNILNYNGIEANIFPGIVAAAPGNTVVQDIVPGATVGVGANTDLLHLGSFNEAAGMTIGQAFAAALGGGTVTGFAPGAGNTIFFSMFDLTTGQMLIGDVNSEFAALHSQLTSADAGSVHLIAAMMMSAADYIAFSTNNLRIVT